MQVRQLECFVAVAEELHFGRAADRLFLAHAAVSQQIRGLEREVGAELFHRTTRRVRLTPAGAQFLERARAVLAEFASLRSLPLDPAVPRGVLHLPYHPTVGPLMSRLARRFGQRYRDVTIVPESLAPFDVPGWLGRSDSAVAFSSTPGGVDVAGLYPGYESAVIGRCTLRCVAVPRGHHFTTRPVLRLADLDGEEVLAAYSHPYGEFVNAVTAYFTERGVRPRWREVPIRDENDQLRAVAANLGVMPMRSRYLRSVEPGVEFIPLVEDGPLFLDVITWSAARPGSLATLFAEFARTTSAMLDDPEQDQYAGAAARPDLVRSAASAAG